MSILTLVYSPSVVTVTPGTTVIWTSKATLPEPHFVTFLAPNPKTGEMQGGRP